MKLFKKIPIKELEHLEINKDGYILDPKTGHLEKFSTNTVYNDILSIEEIINQTFKDGN